MNKFSEDHLLLLQEIQGLVLTLQQDTEDRKKKHQLKLMSEALKDWIGTIFEDQRKEKKVKREVARKDGRVNIFE